MITKVLLTSGVLPGIRDTLVERGERIHTRCDGSYKTFRSEEGGSSGNVNSKEEKPREWEVGSRVEQGRVGRPEPRGLSEGVVVTDGRCGRQY